MRGKFIVDGGKLIKTFYSTGCPLQCRLFDGTTLSFEEMFLAFNKI